MFHTYPRAPSWCESRMRTLDSVVWKDSFACSSCTFIVIHPLLFKMNSTSLLHLNWNSFVYFAHPSLPIVARRFKVTRRRCWPDDASQCNFQTLNVFSRTRYQNVRITFRWLIFEEKKNIDTIDLQIYYKNLLNYTPNWPLTCNKNYRAEISQTVVSVSCCSNCWRIDRNQKITVCGFPTLHKLFNL